MREGRETTGMKGGIETGPTAWRETDTEGAVTGTMLVIAGEDGVMRQTGTDGTLEMNIVTRGELTTCDAMLKNIEIPCRGTG